MSSRAKGTTATQGGEKKRTTRQEVRLRSTVFLAMIASAWCLFPANPISFGASCCVFFFCSLVMISPCSLVLRHPPRLEGNNTIKQLGKELVTCPSFYSVPFSVIPVGFRSASFRRDKLRH